MFFQFKFHKQLKAHKVLILNSIYFQFIIAESFDCYYCKYVYLLYKNTNNYFQLTGKAIIYFFLKRTRLFTQKNAELNILFILHRRFLYNKRTSKNHKKYFYARRFEISLNEHFLTMQAIFRKCYTNLFKVQFMSEVSVLLIISIQFHFANSAIRWALKIQLFGCNKALFS